jgi:Domain of unknown function (DUF4184)
MPFTLSHAAAAFPFRRTRLDWSALVVGTMAPDLEYFLRLAPGQPYGHTFPGVFLVTLPLALVTLWLFHSFVKAPFAELLPESLQRKLSPYMGKFRFGGAARFALILVSLLCGVLTHLAWDSFTHQNTWLVQNWPALRHPVQVALIGSAPLYKLLQYVSTVFGLMVLAVGFAAWYRRAEVFSLPHSPRIRPSEKIKRLAIIATIGLLAGTAYALSAIGVPRHGSFSKFGGVLIVTMMAAAWWQFVVLGVWRSRPDHPAFGKE